MRRIALCLGLGCLLVSASSTKLSAQVSVSTEKLRADSMRADSIRRADSLSGKSNSDEFVKAGKIARNQLSPLPSLGLDNILSPLTRWTFIRDSIEWSTAETVSDVLQRIPGVFVMRGGGFGRPELLSYQGRGAASVTYSFDGVPFQPLGPDSAAVDPSFFSLVMLDRIDVRGGAGILHVDLYTRRHHLQLPQTRINVASGDGGVARYGAAFESRYRSGLGVSLWAENFSINAPTGGTGANAVTNGMLQVSYFPTPRLGAQAELVLQLPDRSALLANGDTLSPRLRGTRSDLQLRGYWKPAPGELGLRVDGFVVRSSWRSDSINQHFTTLGAVAAYRKPVFSSEVSLWHRSEWIPWDVNARAGWTPTGRINASFEVTGQTYKDNRTTLFETASLGLTLPLGVVATGLIRNGHRVQSPLLSDDPEQRFTDMQLTGSYQRKRYGLELGYVRNDGWQPIGFRQIYRAPNLAPLPRVEWATVDARITANSWLTLESVYTHPLLGVFPGGNPPHHAVTSATARSKFLHNFPSGIFDLKFQVLMETWSPGIAGLNTSGNPVVLPGRTFFRSMLELKIGPFNAYYDWANMRGRANAYLPGYTIPGLTRTFGVRWAFLD